MAFSTVWFLCREGYKTFFDTLYQNNIPLFIFSAGIGDILEEIIRQMKVFHPNIHIVSNYMDFSEDVSHVLAGLLRRGGLPVALVPSACPGGLFALCWAFLSSSSFFLSLRQESC